MSKTPRDNPNKQDHSGSKFQVDENAKIPFDDDWNQESRRRSNTEINEEDTVENDFVMNTEGDEYQPKQISLEALTNNEDEFSEQGASEENENQLKRQSNSESNNEKLIQTQSPVQ